MKKVITVILVVTAVWAAPAYAGFDDSNPNSVIYWSPNDLSSTRVTAAFGETVTLFAIINNNNSNYGHEDSGGVYDPGLNWAPAIGYQIGAYWDTDAVVGSSFNWDNNPGYDGPNGQGDPVVIYDDHLYWLFADANWGPWNMFHGEVARYDHYAAWQVQSNRGVWIGGYHPYAYLYENSIVTQFQFTVQEDVFDVVEASWGVNEQGQSYQYYDSSIGLEFAAWNVYENPVLLSSWSINYEAITLRVALPGIPLPGDFDGDGDVDADDIGLLCDNMGGDPDPYDVDEDGDVDEDDLVFLIETLVELQDGSGRIGTKQGDFNLDGFVNGTDLALMKTAFGHPDQNYADGNANCDAFVNGTDLAILKTNFGFIAPPTGGSAGLATGGGVPEPMTIGLLSLGALAMLRRKRS